MAKYESINPSQVEIKVFEKETEGKLAELLKYFDKNALGDKHEKKRMLK